ncbi:hemolysin III [Nematocida minor]|uniref:hemolysin III n=1 Tax=Nematocida minor TaxID=1912983 RepID=UPI00221E66AB|nr:hemolysin III [Nematocida minor]KAI5191090.1 hemolysin III [Nematocida minor]
MEIEDPLKRKETEKIEEAQQNTALDEITSDDCTDSSSGYFKNKLKPYWRGRVHRIAFYTTLCLYVILMFTLSISKIYLSIYFASQLILYGVSSTYHMSNWKTRRAEKFFQKLDHSSIFLLISGTQTCVVVALNELYKTTATNLLKWLPVTYLLAVIGILKVFLIQTVPRYINVIYYIVHGVSVAMFIPSVYIIKERFLGLLCAMGGLVYIVGGVVYGVRKPDPWPLIFGYHEVFHVLTVVANLLFLATIIWADYKVLYIK